METIRKTFRILSEAKEKGDEIIFFDTETEGLDPKEHHIIQVSAIKLRASDYTKLDELNVIVNPERPLDPKITEITGYTDSFLADYLPEVLVFPKIRTFFGSHPFVVGHNVGFDNRMMKALYERQGEVFEPAGVIDSCQMARELLKKGKDVKSHKLIDVADYYGLGKDIDFHKADADVLATFRIFLAMLPEKKPPVPTEMPVANSVGYYEGFRGHNRIYIHTNLGAIWWDAMDKTFGSKEVDMETCDMGPCIEALCKKWRAEDVEDLYKRVRDWFYLCKEREVGAEKSHQTVADAKSYAEKKKHFDVMITQNEDGTFQTKLIGFKKTGKGKITVV